METWSWWLVSISHNGGVYDIPVTGIEWSLLHVFYMISPKLFVGRAWVYPSLFFCGKNEKREWSEQVPPGMGIPRWKTVALRWGWWSCTPTIGTQPANHGDLQSTYGLDDGEVGSCRWVNGLMTMVDTPDMGRLVNVNHERYLGGLKLCTSFLRLWNYCTSKIGQIESTGIQFRSQIQKLVTILPCFPFGKPFL